MSTISALQGLAQKYKVRERARDLLRRTWMKYTMRGVRQADAHGRLDLAYALEDPWRMETARERFRFEKTNEIIREHLGGHFERILEVGSGEGHQTEHLVKLGGKVTGIEVSPTAVNRARGRLASADVELIAGELGKQPWASERARFDLVTACEVVYYMKDIPGFLRTMDELGGACVVTYFAPAARICEAHVMAMPGAQKTTFAFEDTEWVAVWWKGASRRG
jgi:protein-L-isoaspartate O-methyltransferase